MEAEGRALRRGATRLGLELGLIAFAVLLAVAGAGFFLWGLYLFLTAAIGAAGAGVTVGLLALAGALAGFWNAWQEAR